LLQRIRPHHPQDIDVLIYGIPSALRLGTFEALCMRGVTSVFVCGLYGSARDELIARSKVVMNLNRHRSMIFEIVRVSYLLANGKAVVADRQADTIIEPDIESGLALCQPEDLVATCEALLNDDARRNALGEAGRAAMKARLITAILQKSFASGGFPLPKS
jgi:hypothetical protein